MSHVWLVTFCTRDPARRLWAISPESKFCAWDYKLSSSRVYIHTWKEHLGKLKSCSSSRQSSVDYGNTNKPSMHYRLCKATLSQLAFLRESDPNFPQEKSQWDNRVKAEEDQQLHSILIKSDRIVLPDSAPSSIRVGNSDIPFVTHARNLGIAISCNTTMEQHVTNICRLPTLNFDAQAASATFWQSMQPKLSSLSLFSES